jgi:arsenate reductase-like glutaredoxin family protein
MEKILQDGHDACNQAREALRAGGAKGLDAATHPNAEGQARSIELHTKLQDAERVFVGLALGLASTIIIIDRDTATMADLRDWFARTRDEMRAVFETRGLDAPAPAPTVAVVDADAIERVAERAAAKAVEAKSAGTDATGKKQTRGLGWKEAANAAKKYLRKHPWPGHNKLAESIGCLASTLTKAKQHDQVLRRKMDDAAAKAKRTDGPRSVEAVAGLNASGITTDCSREPTVDAASISMDHDATWRRMTEAASSKNRAILHKLSEEQRTQECEIFLAKEPAEQDELLRLLAEDASEHPFTPTVRERSRTQN